MKIYQVVNKETGKRKQDYRTKTVYLRKHAAINRCGKDYVVVEYDLTALTPTEIHSGS